MNLFHDGINSLVDFICYDAINNSIQFISANRSDGNTISLTFNFAPTFILWVGNFYPSVTSEDSWVGYTGFHNSGSQDIYMPAVTTSSSGTRLRSLFGAGSQYPYKSTDGKTLYNIKIGGAGTYCVMLGVKI